MLRLKDAASHRDVGLAIQALARGLLSARRGSGQVARVLRRAVRDRRVERRLLPTAREPDMRRVQASKRPYDAMARVRSAGVLVVGLDQNNLPFSSAHPSPAGSIAIWSR